MERTEWIDSVKGIGMILVIMGHATLPILMDKYILSFHMPLFFLLAGLVCTIKPECTFMEFLKRKIRSLIIPYLSFSAFFYIFWVFVERNISSYYKNSVHPLKPFLGIFYGVNEGDFMAYSPILWFITCLFIVEIIFYFLQKWFTSRIKLFYVLFIFSIIGYLSSVFLNIRLPWNIDVALTAVVFYGIGYLFKNKINNLVKINARNKIFIILILVILNLILSSLNKPVTMFKNNYGNYFYFYTCSFLGILTYLVMGMLLSEFRWLKYIGKNSLIFMVIHPKVILYSKYLMAKILSINARSLNQSIFLAIILTTISIIVTIPIKVIITSKFSFFLGKKFEEKKSIDSSI